MHIFFKILTNGFAKNDDAPVGGINDGGSPGIGGMREP